MFRVLPIFGLLLTTQVCGAISLSLNSASSNASMLTALNSVGEFKGIDLLLLNESNSDVQIASSQFSIGIVPALDSIGEVIISSLSTSLDPFFNLPPMLIGSSSDFLTYSVSDAPIGPFPTGVVLNSGTSAGIATIDLEWNPSTLGSFEIVVRPINVASPLESSHWVDPSVLFVAQPYDNSDLSNEGNILLATLSITTVPEPSAVFILCNFAIAFLKRRGKSCL